VNYVKRNFLAGQTFADVQAMNERVKHWITKTAGQRIHGTTKEAPLARFHRGELDTLQPLPTTPFDLVATYYAKVHRDCHAHVNSRHYSVPYRFIGRKVELYIGQKIVEIYCENELVTTHPVVKEKGGWSTRSEHYPESKREWMENPPERCQERAQAIGESCAEVVRLLLGDRVQDRLRSVQSLLRLSGKVGAERLEKACRRACHYGDPSYRRVKSILNARLDNQSIECEDPKVITLSSYRFVRSASSFFEKEVPSC